MLNDFAVSIYLFTLIVSFYGLMLFIWWWHVNGRASEVYIYMTALFAGHTYSTSLSLYARSLLNSGEGYVEFLNSNLWKTRILFIAVILFLIVLRMTQRAMNGEKKP